MPQLAPPVKAAPDRDAAEAAAVFAAVEAAPGPDAASGPRAGTGLGTGPGPGPAATATGGTTAAPTATGGTRIGTTTPRVVHTVGDTLAVRAAGTEILRHRYRPVPHPTECPSPYAYPLRTLAGRPVTATRPRPHGRQAYDPHLYDSHGPDLHRPDLRAYDRRPPYDPHPADPDPYHGGGHTHGAPGHGYAELPGVHRLDRTGFTALAANGRTAFTETGDWLTADGERWIAEERTWEVRDLDPEGGNWTLEFRTALLNVRGEAVHFGTEGHQPTHPCGSFWRGPRDFAADAVRTPDAEGAAVVNGRRAPWIALTAEPRGAGRRGDPRDPVTVVLAADPGLPGGAPYWTVRGEPTPVVNPSLALPGALPLAPAATLRLAYRLVIADGRWDRDRIAAHLADHPW